MIARTPLQQRLIALAILFALAVGAWFGLLRPLAHFLITGATGFEQSERVSRAYEDAVASAPALRAQLEALRKQEASLPGLFVGKTSALAAAALQSELKKLIEANGGEIRSAQTLPPTSNGDYEEIALRYDIGVSMRSFEHLLFQIETHEPYLFIDHVDIRALESSSPTNRSIVDPKLSIRWEIGAYRWRGGS